MAAEPTVARPARIAAYASALLITACAPKTGQAVMPLTAPTDAPYVLVVGTAQDGGLPQMACRQPCCESARANPSERRLVTSLVLVDPRRNARWLFDASPHLPLQIERARGHGRDADAIPVGRPALFDGVFLTHAHMGHYGGLLQFGREAYGSEPVDLYGTPRLLAFLGSNGPWSLLFDGGHANGRTLGDREIAELGGGLTVTALSVPHRDEFSDTVAFRIDSDGRSLLYVPDIDKWDQWSLDLCDVVRSVDVALVDGTFYGPDELPGRNMADVPHPFIVESMALLDALPPSERAKVVFTHLNHSNPAADPTSEAAQEIARRGYRVAAEGQIIPLR